MGKSLNVWGSGALHLYAQCEANVAVMQLLKVVTEATGMQDNPDSAIEVVLSGKFFDLEKAKQTLYEMNHDVFVEVHFANDSRKVTMPYAACQDKLASWTEQGVGVTWWPINFKTFKEARACAVDYLVAALKQVSKKRVSA